MTAKERNALKDAKNDAGATLKYDCQCMLETIAEAIETTAQTLKELKATRRRLARELEKANQ